jgi:hypothetical protein
MEKTFFIKQSLTSADSHQQHYKMLSVEEKAKVFLTLMQAAYGFVGKDWPKMEKTFTGARRIHVK